MGTRHLICVVKNGEYKVAQYGQWDGYPSGVGVDILKFICNPDNITRLNKSLDKVRFLDIDGVDKEFIEDYNKNAPEWSNEPDNRTEKQIYWWKTFMHRDLSASVLKNIIESQDDEIVLGNGIEFAKDSLFCEWAYVIDLDKTTFEVYCGFNKSPLNSKERFFFNDAFDDGYYPVRFICGWLLGDPPSENEFIETVDSKTNKD